MRKPARLASLVLKASILSVALSACMANPTESPLLSSRVEPLAVQSVYYATTRQPSGDRTLFSASHSDDPFFGLVQVGVPREHEPGQMDWPRGEPNPTRHFHTRGVREIPSLDAFVADSTQGQPGAMVFVHGYNNEFLESVYRLAQIAHDIRLPGAAIQFSWASAGELSGYITDRDRALLSRYALADLIASVGANASGRISLVAHSMGSLALMEALKVLNDDQLAVLASRLNDIALIAPDIDAELFEAQSRATGLPPSLFVVAINRDDRLLGLSSALAGGRDRLGARAEV
ncbi:MAG: alpha/beta hydrolase, partial [Devosiaceae bacterium]|nr:alpha/beta hydrolase [Devosiaceae bacterium MH13]